MAKRKYADDDTTGDDGSEYEDAMPKPKPAKKSRSSTKRRKDPSNTDTDDFGDAAQQHPVSRHSVTSPASVCSALLDWYAGVHESRGMPWRKPYNPLLGQEARSQRAYEVWVSEIMLQQTQVATVIPYYNKWMERFPTVKDLASSDIETVNSLWKGLGYYSRAARLLRGSQYVMEKLAGQMPRNAEDMQAQIPGIGRYSAGAICSIAYNQQVPVLDGNVHRLLSRFLALYSPPKKSTLDVLWSRATLLVENTDRPGDLNQALIELGSVVCKVRDPSCAICPIRSWCQAYQGAQDQPPSQATEIADIEELCSLCEPLPGAVAVTVYPMKPKRKTVREELDVVNVVEWRCHDNKRWFLLVRRPGKGLLAGLHEFPTMPNVSQPLNLNKISHSLLCKLLARPPRPFPANQEQKADSSSDPPEDTDSLRITMIKLAGDVIHVFSHIRKTYRVQWTVLEGGGVHPPKLCAEPVSSIKKSQKARTSGKSTGRIKEGGSTIDVDHEETGSSSTPVPSHLRWVPLQEVTDANVGNGVLKVWNQVKTLWEDKRPQQNS